MRFDILFASAALAGIALAAVPTIASTQHSAEVAQAPSQPIRIDRPVRLYMVPVELRCGKIVLNAKIGEETCGFVFDTGSPTTLARAFADRAGVRHVGRNANGAEDVMDIAVMSQLYENTRAAAAGLKLGDVVHAVDGQMLTDMAPVEECGRLDRVLDHFEPNEARTLTVRRNGERIDIPIAR